MKPIYLEPSQVPSALRGAYSGNKFKAYVTESVTVPADAGIWGGGSRDLYSFVEIATGRVVKFPGQNCPPWNSDRRDWTSQLPEGVAMVEHSIFGGKDMGLTFYIRPENAQKLLPAPQTLTETEKLVLEATRSFKSTHMGKDRYQMKREECWGWRNPELGPFPSREEWESAKAALIEKKLLNKAGAITPAGRNAI